MGSVFFKGVKHRTISLYRIIWDNGHSCGTFPSPYPSKRKAIKAGNQWRREMISIEQTPEERKSAAEDYDFDLEELIYYVEKDQGVWYVYDRPDCPRAAIVKECPFCHVLPSLLRYVEKLDRKATIKPGA